MKSRFTFEQWKQRFYENVNTGGSCWLWTGKRNAQDYGRMYANLEGKKYYTAHRVSYALHHGKVPDGMQVLHNCDNPWCVNPDHLRLGTQLENQAESRAKGRTNRGEKNRNAKLTEDDVRAIRKETGTHTEIGRKYGIDSTHVKRIIDREKWGHVE